MTRSRASTAEIPEGQTSIDRVTPYQRDGQKTWYIDWSVRLMDGRLLRKRSQGRTQAAARRAARNKAKDLLSTHGEAGAWKISSPIDAYAEEVTRPAIEKADLRENSRRRYLLAVRHLLGTEDKGRVYRLKGHTIGSLTSSFTTMERLLQEIAERHGKESGRQAKTVLSRYLLDRLKRDGLIQANALRGERIAGVDDRKPMKTSEALSIEEYDRVISHLLVRDPNETKFPGSRTDRREKPATQAKHRQVILLTLVQASTGTRINESLALQWSQVKITDESVTIAVSPETSKTATGREIPVLVPEVAQRLREIAPGAEPEHYVISSPANPAKRWDNSNAISAVATLYPALAKECDVPALMTSRSHSWRATLNTLTAGTLPDSLRAAYFGHTEEENQRSYTRQVDTAPMVQAISDLRKTTR